MSLLKKDDGGPAFPRLGEGFGNPNYDCSGMSLRDWFAGMALEGYISNSGSPMSVAKDAYDIADAMIEVRKK